MKTIAVLALQGVVPFDLGIACDVFSRVVLADGRPAYRVLVCGESPRVDAGGHFDIRAPWKLDDALGADRVVVPGVEDIEPRAAVSTYRALRAAHDGGAQLASICTGAFVLAEAGLLDGRRATTHWAAAGELARRYPALTVDTDVLFADEGDIVTSAGSSAGLDMCLHLVGRDYGQAAAVQAARLAVAPLHRDGGQAPFIRQPVVETTSSLSSLCDWMLRNMHRPIDVNALAARARMTPRTFARRFLDQTGTTPIQWLIRQRIRRAQELLETSEATVDQVASASGFDSTVTFRARFQRVVGLTPSAYRKRFKGS